MDARTLHAMVPIAIAVGLAFSAYAWYESVTPAAQGSCTVNGFFSCQKVDQSAFTTTLGVPDYLFGVGGFAAMLVVDVPLLRTYRRPWLLTLAGLSGIGLVLSIYLAWVELAEIRALCLICTGAYLSNVVVFALVATLVRQQRADAAGD